MLRWAHPLVRPELGCLVVANGDLFTQHQQYFYKAVILIIQHGDDGSVGLILNRPTTFTMGDVCTGDLHRVPGMEDNVSTRPGLCIYGHENIPQPFGFNDFKLLNEKS